MSIQFRTRAHVRAFALKQGAGSQKPRWFFPLSFRNDANHFPVFGLD
jgi:hypothetical protein